MYSIQYRWMILLVSSCSFNSFGSRFKKLVGYLTYTLFKQLRTFFDRSYSFTTCLYLALFLNFLFHIFLFQVLGDPRDKMAEDTTFFLGQKNVVLILSPASILTQLHNLNCPINWNDLISSNKKGGSKPLPAQPDIMYSANILEVNPSWIESGLISFILGLHLLGIISPTGSNELQNTIYILQNLWLDSHYYDGPGELV